MARKQPKLARQIDQALGVAATAPTEPSAPDAPAVTTTFDAPSESAALDTAGVLDTSLPRVRGKLSYDQISLILQMSAAGEPVKAIAAYFQIRAETVWRLLQKFADTSAEAKARLKMSAARLADAALLAADRGAQRGDGSVALELLDRLDVAPKRMAQASASGVQVMVVVGGNNPSALPDFSARELSGAPDGLRESAIDAQPLDHTLEID